MAERMIWKGTLSFGLVEIPVGLVSAETPSEIKLSFLDRRDFSPVGYNRYNKTTGEDVPWSEIVRGYEHEKGEYVVLSDADLKRANPKLTQTIEILGFVDAADIEPIYFEKPYYLEPLKKGKGYVLLREALQRTKKVAISRVVIRTKEHMAAVGVRGKALVLYLLRYAQEVRPTEDLGEVDVDLSDVGVKSKEVEMAKRLIEDMVTEWKPEEYTDDYHAELMSVIEGKIEAGEMHTLTPDEEETPMRKRGEIIDLMPLLEKSIDAAKRTRRGRPVAARSTKRATARARPKRRRTG
jgi:DNA end-binding protein Ku